MPDPKFTTAGRKYAAEVTRLVNASSSREPSFYSAIKTLWNELLAARSLPFETRVETREGRPGGGADHPDLAIYGGGGTYLVVPGEAKLSGGEVQDAASSTEGNNQIGRYLAQTSVCLVTNIRSIAMVAVRPGAIRKPGRPIPLGDREVVSVVHLWPTEEALRAGRPIQATQLDALASLLERAVVEFAPISEPEVLAGVLAAQARQAKKGLPAQFDAVQGLLEDYGIALGLTFQGDEGEEFFRSSLIQTAFYGLFAGWTLWHRTNDGKPFTWENLERYLKIPFLGKLFYEFRHPDRLAELNIARHLDRAAETLRRVNRDEFFKKFHPLSIREELEKAGPATPDVASAAITYFYEPFLEAFDPDLRKELGVWYTPPEIVRYQVRKIDRLLRDELNCPRGFADDGVVVLDPCCGTGAYLIEVIRCVAEQLHSEGQDTALGAEILQAVCRRIIGFEILTAPFVISQLQLYLILSELDAAPGAKQRPAIYLTNALTGWGGPEQIKLNFPELKAEHEAARSVKHDARIIVILGNPPYNRFAGAAIQEEADLVDHYKGIRRDEKGKQLGQSELFTRWGVRKQLLDDFYIRFIRLAEKRIGEVAEYGVVSFISNSSFLTGRSHPLMRESLLKNFHSIWVDNLNGDKYRTGKLIPKGLVGEGTSDQSAFTTENDPRGIQVGTCISTCLKRKAPRTPPAETRLHYREFWGRAKAKRQSLLESQALESWSEKERVAAADRPEGPRVYEDVTPSSTNRWMLAPREVSAGFESWPALDELFPVSFQGVNPNRGLEGSVVDTDREALAARMKTYFAARRFEYVQRVAPVLCEPRARYDPEETWAAVRSKSRFDDARVVPYLLFPLDQRWLYYEAIGKFLNEARREYWENLVGNEFFITVPQPRKISETRPLLTSVLADLHVHDRGSVCFPARIAPARRLDLFESGDDDNRRPNIASEAWSAFKQVWKLKGDLAGSAAEALVLELFRAALALMHSPQYESDHRDGIAQDWAHLPIPKDRDLFRNLVEAGDSVALLLDSQSTPDGTVKRLINERGKTLGVMSKKGAASVRSEDLQVTVSYFGAAIGKWQEREFREGEMPVPSWGTMTGDLFINAAVSFGNVPQAVWRYELGGYPVLKKWLGYRHSSRREGRPLTLAEARHFRSIVQRIAALLAIHDELDRLYEAAAADAFTARELGID